MLQSDPRNLLKRFQRCQLSGNKCYSNQLFSLLLEQYESSIYDEYGIEGEEEGSSVPPLACEFSKGNNSSHYLGLVDENGYVVIYNTNKCGDEAIVKDWRAHSNAIFDLAWMEGDNKLLTAAGDQTIVLWDITTSKQINNFQGHTSSVRSVNFKTNDAAVFATGSRDGHVMIWDIRCNRKGLFSSPVQVIRNAHSIPHLLKAKKKSKLGPSRDSQQSVTIVIYQTDTTLLSAGAVDGCVKMWDLRKNYSTSTSDPSAKHTFNYCGLNKRSHGYSSLVVDSSRTQLFASCTDDIIYQFDLLSLSANPVSCFKGHQNKSFYVKSAISPDDRFLLSGSSNDFAYIWKIDKPNESPVVLKGHNAEVTDVAWNSNDFTKMATLSDDNTMRIWRLNRRLSPREPGIITGYSERTHREIGITTNQQVEITPNKAKNIPKSISPTIFHFLNKSAQKSKPSTSACDTTAEKVCLNTTHANQSETITKSGSSNENLSQKKVTVIASSQETNVREKRNNEGKSRLPCKRKLVCDEDEEENNPSKRQNIREMDFIANNPNSRGLTTSIPRSPNNQGLTASIPRSPNNRGLSTSIPRSPWKCDENPDKWLHTQNTSSSPIGSPRKRSEVLKEIPPTLNSPPKRDEQTKQLVPSHVKTKLFNHTQSPTVNLPNLVVEGTVRDINVNFKKCDKENSPKKSKIDWLTKKRLEKESEHSSLTRKDASSPKISKTKLSFEENNVLRKELSSPKVNKRSKLHEITPKKKVSSCQSKEENSQENNESSKETPSKGMKSLKHYFSVK